MLWKKEARAGIVCFTCKWHFPKRASWSSSPTGGPFHKESKVKVGTPHTPSSHHPIGESQCMLASHESPKPTNTAICLTLLNLNPLILFHCGTHSLWNSVPRTLFGKHLIGVLNADPPSPTTLGLQKARTVRSRRFSSQLSSYSKT